MARLVIKNRVARFIILLNFIPQTNYGNVDAFYIKVDQERASYILCIDGGGSKTELEVLDIQGNTLVLHKNGKRLKAIKVGCSNINSVGEVGVEAIIRDLLDGLYIDDMSISSIMDQCMIVGGFAGAGKYAKDFLIKAFAHHGFNSSRVIIMDDLELLKQVIDTHGIVLIAGTGSVAFGRYNNREMRVGGFGRHLGDEGSGYHIGLQALKACLKCEYGYGDKTVLLADLRNYFDVLSLKDIIRSFYDGKILPTHIASLAPIVFKRSPVDNVAAKLVDCAAQDLGSLIGILKNTLNMSLSTLYVSGGIFKNEHVQSFIHMITRYAKIEGWRVVNLSHINPTAMVVKSNLLG